MLSTGSSALGPLSICTAVRPEQRGCGAGAWEVLGELVTVQTARSAVVGTSPDERVLLLNFADQRCR